MIFWLSRCRQCRNRTAMKAIPCSDNLRFIRSYAMRVLACDLDRAFICLCTGVAEERLTKSAECDEFCRSICLRLRIVKIGYMDELPRLLANRIDERLVIMTEDIDRYTAE